MVVQLLLQLCWQIIQLSEIIGGGADFQKLLGEKGTVAPSSHEILYTCIELM